MSIADDIPDYVYRDFINRLEEKGFEYLSHGSFRRVWERGNIVVKVPDNHDGLIDNRVEAHAWRIYRNRPSKMGIVVAPCRLLPNGCLMMVKVEDGFGSVPVPDWSDMIDHDQVGVYKGRAVAYDAALDLHERLEWEKEWGVESIFFHSEYLDRCPHLRTGEKPDKVA
jgi:hypothetical protein